MSGMFIVLQPITGDIFTPKKPATNGFRSVMQGCALTAPGRLRRLTFSFGRLKKSSRSPGQALLLLVQCSVKRAEKFDILVLAC